MVSFEGGDGGAIGDESSQMRDAFLHSEKIQDSDHCADVHINKVPPLSWPQKLDPLVPPYSGIHLHVQRKETGPS